jgi:hypothetical protein
VRRSPLGQRGLTAARKGGLDRGELADGLTAAGLPSADGVVDGLLLELREHAERVALERRELRTVKALGRPTYELPHLPDGVDLGGLYELAGLLRKQGAA